MPCQLLAWFQRRMMRWDRPRARGRLPPAHASTRTPVHPHPRNHTPPLSYNNLFPHHANGREGLKIIRTRYPPKSPLNAPIPTDANRSSLPCWRNCILWPHQSRLGRDSRLPDRCTYYSSHFRRRLYLIVPRYFTYYSKYDANPRHIHKLPGWSSSPSFPAQVCLICQNKAARKP